jgi:hypothetical protein
VVTALRRHRQDLLVLAAKAVHAGDEALLRHAAEALARLDAEVPDGSWAASRIARAIQEAIDRLEPQRADEATPGWQAGRPGSGVKDVRLTAAK